MIILDTDTLSIYQKPQNPLAMRLRARIAMVPSSEEVGTTIISYEEQTRGWFAILAKARNQEQRIQAYQRLLRHLENWRKMNVLPFDEKAAAKFDELERCKLRIGRSDQRIAAICLVHDALLLSRNLQDFTRVPGLLVEDWAGP
jgi:tRNA(fMet)-specific endonuclease VapC